MLHCDGDSCCHAEQFWSAKPMSWFPVWFVYQYLYYSQTSQALTHGRESAVSQSGLCWKLLDKNAFGGRYCIELLASQKKT